jgi:NADPH:quinone reductase
VKAVVIHAPGAPEQLVMADMPEPSPGPGPGPGEVMADVAFAGCNWGGYPDPHRHLSHHFTYPLVLGFEFSGMVSSCGVKVGERVTTFVEKGGAYAEKALAPPTVWSGPPTQSPSM